MLHCVLSKEGIIAVAAGGFAIALLYHHHVKSRNRIALLSAQITALSCQGRPFCPALPTAAEVEAGASRYGGLVRIGPILIQRGSFNALWIRIGHLDDEAPSLQLLLAVVSQALKSQGALQPVKAAVYLGISEKLLHSSQSIQIQILRSLGFQFHHFRPGKAVVEFGEFVYVADLAKMVPAYATSIEGATGVVMSPDECKVLAVWERGGWNTPGGAIDFGEMKIDGLSREIFEEVGVRLDPDFSPLYLGGYQAARARDEIINDNFSAFAVRAANDQIEVDRKEIHIATWLPWRVLVNEWIAAGKPVEDKNVHLDSDALPADKKLVSRNLLRWLDTYGSGKAMPCKITAGRECKIGWLDPRAFERCNEASYCFRTARR